MQRITRAGIVSASTAAALQLLSISSALAQVQGAAPAHRPGFGDILGNLFPLIVMVFLIFYFMVTRPQQQRLKAMQDLHGALKKGDLVMTTSGIIARVSSIESDHFVLEIASGVRVKFEKSAVSRKVEKVDQSKSESKE